MKKIIICFIFFLILHPVTSFSEETHVYTDSDLEKYKTSSSDKAHQNQDVVGQQNENTGYQKYQDIHGESERNNQATNENQRRREADRLKNK